MASTKKKQKKAQAAKAAAWKQQERTVVHYTKLTVGVSTIAAATSAAGWAVEGGLVPVVAGLLDLLQTL